MGKKCVKFTYKEVSDFVLNNSNCKLLSTEYVAITNKLEFECECGNKFHANFRDFKHSNKRQCNECGRNNVKFSIEEISEIAKNRGYELVDTEYLGMYDKLTLRDAEGYWYYTSLSNLHHVKRHPRRFHKTNIYSVQNIKHFLQINYSEFELLDSEYLHSNQKLSLITKDGYKCVTTMSSIVQGHKPLLFIKSNPYTIENIKIWLKLNNKNFELISDEYVDNTKDLLWKCHKKGCEEIFSTPWSEVQTGSGCGYCAGRTVGISNCLATNYPDLAKEFHPSLNGNLTAFNILSGTHNKVWWQCSKCGHAWFASVCKRSGSQRGCPVCNVSRGETYISKFLRLKNVKNTPQKKFKYLIGLGNGQLSYDFYLPKYNLLIEYQGRFHEEKLYDDHDFETQQEHDRRKREYANVNNINLLEIWYWDYDNIEEILTKELNLDVSKTNDIGNSVVFNK